MAKTPKKPQAVIRDGNLKATLWANQSSNGSFISVTFAKTYDDNGTPKDTHSFTGTDVLRVAQLATESYRVANRLRREMNAAASEEAPEASAQQAQPETSTNELRL